ncbi:MAG: hypothetical protein PHI12_11325 [Dehalococcoidales bacterium]|nr:hypothetical protein [Dehalococcoidales bacterium]
MKASTIIGIAGGLASITSLIFVIATAVKASAAENGNDTGYRFAPGDYIQYVGVEASALHITFEDDYEHSIWKVVAPGHGYTLLSVVNRADPTNVDEGTIWTLSQATIESKYSKINYP